MKKVKTEEEIRQQETRAEELRRERKEMDEYYDRNRPEGAPTAAERRFVEKLFRF